MSDQSGDEMDIDAPPSNLADAMTFTAASRDSKGKRSAANLPVEAEDGLPWVEKYRPNSLEEVNGHKDVLDTIGKFVDANRLPHLLLYGPPGTGKTSTVLALARRIYGAKNMRQMVLELNASDDRGIDVVREQIKTFSSTKQIFNSFTTSSTSSKSSPLQTYKLIILDEADSMTSTAQMALRRIIEKYTANTRFAILANYAHKLSPALLSRCTRFRFSPLDEPSVRKMVDMVIAVEGVRIGQAATEALVRLSKGDMRRALNVLQACHASSLPLLPSHGGRLTKAEEKEAWEARETITETAIYDCIASPQPSDILQILRALLSTPDISSCLSALEQVKKAKGLALSDILTGISEEMLRLDVPRATRVVWCEGLADVEYRLSGGGSEHVQSGALVGVVRTGVELMERNGASVESLLEKSANKGDGIVVGRKRKVG